MMGEMHRRTRREGRHPLPTWKFSG